MADERMMLREHVARFERLPGAPTPLWTRLVIETAGGEFWVAAANFHPELESLAGAHDQSVSVLTHEGHEYIQLDLIMAASDDARELGESIKLSLRDAKCRWRKPNPSGDL